MKSPYRYLDTNETPSVKVTKNAVVSFLPAGTGLKVLDIGCGNGWFANYLQEMGHNVTGIDMEKTGIELAQKRFPLCRFIQLAIQEDMHEIIKDTFDVIVCIEVIEHLYDTNELLRAVKKLLKNDKSVFIVTTSYYGYMKNIALAIFNRLDEHYRAYVTGGHIKFFSVRALRKMLELNGFRDIRFKRVGRIMPIFARNIVCCSRFISREKR